MELHANERVIDRWQSLGKTNRRFEVFFKYFGGVQKIV